MGGLQQPGRRDRVRLAALMGAGLAYALQQVIVVPALPAFQHDFHTGPTWSAWVFTGFLLVSSVSTPILSRLGDQFGRKRLLVTSLLLFLAGSLLAIGAWDIASLIAARSIQGFGGAVLPLSFAIVRDQFPREKVPGALSGISMVFGISAPIGLLAAGPIIEHLSWRYLFVIGAAGIALAAVLVHRYVEESPVQAQQKIDVPGAVLLTGTLSALLIALTEGNSWGWTGPRTLGLFALSAVLAVAWGVVERRTAVPMVDLRMLRRRQVLLTNLTTLFVGGTTFGAYLAVPGFVETPAQFDAKWSSLAGYGFAATTTVASLYLIPSGLVQLGFGPLAGRLMRALGPAGTRGTFASQGLLVCGGTAFMALFHDHGWQVIVGLSLMGAGVAMGLATAPSLIAEEVHISETGVANGINMISRTVGGVIGSQIAAALIAARTIGDSPIPQEWGYTAAWTASAVSGALALAVAAPLLVRRAGAARAVWERE